MKSRKEISNHFGISEQYLSMLFNGERKVSWNMAEKLSDLFPGKSISEWKRSNPEEFRAAFSQLEKETAA
jgi:plasmid maintenance system antidote protein VapI